MSLLPVDLSKNQPDKVSVLVIQIHSKFHVSRALQYSVYLCLKYSF